MSWPPPFQLAINPPVNQYLGAYFRQRSDSPTFAPYVRQIRQYAGFVSVVVGPGPADRLVIALGTYGRQGPRPALLGILSGGGIWPGHRYIQP